MQFVAASHSKIAKQALECSKHKKQIYDQSYNHHFEVQPISKEVRDAFNLRKSRLSLSVSRQKEVVVQQRNVFKCDIRNVEERLKILQRKLDESQEENSNLIRELNDCRNEREQYKEQVQMKKKEFEQFIDEVQQEMSKRINQFEQIYAEQSQRLERVTQDNQLFEILLKERDQKIQKLQQQLESNKQQDLHSSKLQQIDLNTKQEITKLLTNRNTNNK